MGNNMESPLGKNEMIAETEPYRFDMMMNFEKTFSYRPNRTNDVLILVPFIRDEPAPRFPDADRFELLAITIETICKLSGAKPPRRAKEYVGMLVRETMKRGWSCSRDRLHTLYRLSRVLCHTGDTEQPLRLLAHAQRLARYTYGSMDAGLVRLYGLNGWILTCMDMFPQACQLYEKAIAVAESNRISGEPLFWKYFSLATCRATLDMHDEAVVALHRARDVSQQSDIPTRVAVGMVNWALHRLELPEHTVGSQNEPSRA